MSARNNVPDRRPRPTTAGGGRLLRYDGLELPETPSVRDLLTFVEPVAAEAACDQVVNRFFEDDALYALPVVNEDGTPLTLLDRFNFVEFFSRRYVREVHGRKALAAFLRRKPASYRHATPIMVEESTSIDDLAQIIIDADTRQMPHLASGFIVTRRGLYTGIGNGHDLLQEMTRRKQAELYFLAHYDHLTRLPNRMLFNDRLSQACREAIRNGSLTGVLFVDLDRFKQINDSMGHGFGDQLLCAVAERIRSCVRDCDTVARLGGDEFAILMEMPERAEEVDGLARRVVNSMNDPFDIMGREVFVTASVGLSIYPNDDTDITRLFAKADAAMYEAKAGGRNGYRKYAPGTSMYNLDRVALDTDLRAALENQEFVLHYQPQLDLGSGRVVGVEALIRWQHPRRGLLSPAYFIEAAEENGLIAGIGQWVLRQACRQSRDWRDAGLPELRMAVNISALQFRQTDFAGMVQSVIEETGVPPGAMELELTESVVMHNVAAVVAMLDELKRLGVMLAIDDFGTGFSSLSYLRRFPLDRLKVDQSFVHGIDRLPANESIVRAIVSMARNLALDVIAEGTETPAEAAIIRACGCNEAQGYLFAKPMAPEEFVRWWDRRGTATEV